MLYTLKKLNKSYNDLLLLAYTDTTLNIYNRNFLNEFKKTFTDKAIYVYMCDVNNLKHINDSLGHDVGDKYLKEVVDLLKMFFSAETDYIIRLGGDEFLVLSEKYFSIPTTKISIGVVFKEKNISLYSVMKKADILMYKEKQYQKMF